MAAGAACAGAVVMQMERDTAYGLTLVWALVAVYGEQSSRAVRWAATNFALLADGATLYLRHCHSTNMHDRLLQTKAGQTRFPSVLSLFYAKVTIVIKLD